MCMILGCIRAILFVNTGKKEVFLIFAKMKKYMKSMRLQLFVVLLLIGCVPMSIFIEVISSRYEAKAVDYRLEDISRRLDLLADKISQNRILYGEDNAEVTTEIRIIAEQYSGRVILLNSKCRMIQDTYTYGTQGTAATTQYYISEPVMKAMKGEETNRISSNTIEITLPIYTKISVDNNVDGNVIENGDKANTSDTTIGGALFVIVSIEDIHKTMDSVHQKTYLLIILFVLIMFFFAYWFSYLVTKPFKKMVAIIDQVSESSFNETVSISGYSEVESMVDSFNKMIGRIQHLENSRQEFVSNVSHELKTPITSVKVLADSLLMQEDAPPELYREFLVDITEEIERENKIINDLLSLVKLDKTAGEMNISSVDINELLEQILKRLKPIASTRNIELIFESFRSVMAEVDEVKLSLAISNLIENAIKYNYDEGWVRVSLNADHKFFYVKVADSGVGIPEELQDHIFERFYRVDKARSRETGGTGLGLSITRNAVLMHRGAIKVYSKEKEGTTFTVRIPLNYIS